MSFIDKICQGFYAIGKKDGTSEFGELGIKNKGDESVYSSQDASKEKDVSSLKEAEESAKKTADDAEKQVEQLEGKVKEAKGKLDDAQKALDGIGKRPEAKTITNTDGSTATDDSAGKDWDAKKILLEAALQSAKKAFEDFVKAQEVAKAEKETAQEKYERAQADIEKSESENKEIANALENAADENENSQDLKNGIWADIQNEQAGTDTPIDPVNPKIPKYPFEPKEPTDIDVIKQKYLAQNGVEQKVEDVKELEKYGISDTDTKDKNVYKSTDKDGNTVIQLKDANGKVTKAYVFKNNKSAIAGGYEFQPFKNGDSIAPETPEDKTGYATYIEYTFNTDGEPETAVEYAAQTDKDGNIIYGGPSSENKVSTNNEVDPSSWSGHKPLTAAEAANLYPDTTYPIEDTGFASQFLPDGTKVEDIDPNDPELAALRSGEVAINNTVFEKLCEKFEFNPETGNFKFDAEHSYDEFKAMIAIETQKATEEYAKEHPEYAKVKEKADKAMEEHDNYMEEQMKQYSDLSINERIQKREELEKEYRETHKDYVRYLAQKTPGFSIVSNKFKPSSGIIQKPAKIPYISDMIAKRIRKIENWEDVINNFVGFSDETKDAIKKAVMRNDK